VRLCEHVEIVLAGAGEDAHAAAWVERDRLVPDRARGARREGREHARPDGRHLHRGRAADRGDELTAERGLPRDQPVAFAFELDRVADEAGVEAHRHARRHLASPCGGRHQDRPRRFTAGEFCNRASDVFLDVLAVEVHDLVGAPADELLGIRRLHRDGEHVAGELRGRAEQLASAVVATGLEHHDRARRLHKRFGNGRGDLVVALGVEGTARDEEPHRRVDLFGERRVEPAAPGSIDGHDLDGPHPRRRCVLPPRTRAELGGCHGPDHRRRHCGAPRWVDLRGVGEAFGRRQDRGQPHLGLQPAVVEFATRVDTVAVDREMADAGEEGQVEQFGELGTNLTGVGVDRVAAREQKVERPLTAERGGERLRGRKRVGARERGVGDVHARDVDVALASPRNRFAQRVVRGGRPEREHGNTRAGALRRELARFGDRAAAVRVHLELDPVAAQSAVFVELHLVELRDLLDEDRDAHREAPGES
jgi:hypothetical protein